MFPANDDFVVEPLDLAPVLGHNLLLAAFSQLRLSRNFIPVFDQDGPVAGDIIFINPDFRRDYLQNPAAVIPVDDLNPAVQATDDGFSLGIASLEQLLNPGQTVGDIFNSGHTTGMEGPQ